MACGCLAVAIAAGEPELPAVLTAAALDGSQLRVVIIVIGPET